MRIIHFTIFALLLLLSYGTLLADDAQIGGRTSFLQSLTLEKLSDANFGDISFSADNFGLFILDPANGNIGCTNTTDYTCPSSGTRGAFRVSGTTNNAVEIFCETQGTLANGASTLLISSSSFFIDSTTTTCLGLTNAAYEHTLNSDPAENTIYTGHVLVVLAGGLGDPGVYSTLNAGGDPIKFSVVYK